MTIITAKQVAPAGGAALANLCCPGCGQLGTFEQVGQDYLADNAIRVGLRRCPDLDCRALLFTVWDGRQGVQFTRSYPALRIDFDKTNIPAGVVSALEEAITSHANECFIAAAIMVRKALEQLCRDRGAQGDDLKQRIRHLGTKIVIPSELLGGLDDLRLLGNDAAHIESREYDQIGKEEIEVGIEFAKEVLKATYQHAALLKRLRALKKNSAGSQSPLPQPPPRKANPLGSILFSPGCWGLGRCGQGAPADRVELPYGLNLVQTP
jgi:hypothetical protein